MLPLRDHHVDIGESDLGGIVGGNRETAIDQWKVPEIQEHHEG
jgi:hypothetical protein